ncbi:hypothetical protein BH11ARM2_BH11ARM2_31130 [soil metagenome]
MDHEAIDPAAGDEIKKIVQARARGVDDGVGAVNDALLHDAAEKLREEGVPRIQPGTARIEAETVGMSRLQRAGMGVGAVSQLLGASSTERRVVAETRVPDFAPFSTTEATDSLTPTHRATSLSVVIRRSFQVRSRGSIALTKPILFD